MEKLIMFPMAIPDFPPQYAQVVITQASEARQITATLDTPDTPKQYGGTRIAQAKTGQGTPAAKERAIGMCLLVQHNPPPGEQFGGESLGPEGLAAMYFSRYEKREVERPPFGNVEAIGSPKHGKLTSLGEYLYLPDPGYLGDDRAVFRVKIDGTTVRLVYLLRITDLGVDRAGVDDLLCKKTGKFWKISSDIQEPVLANSPSNNPSAKEWVPSADDPGDLLGQEPEIKFVTWWAEEKDKNPVKHFPVFKSADATSAIQYCTLNAAATRIDCSKTRNGPVEVTYERQRMNSKIAKQFKEEKRMTPMRSFGCRKGCSKDSPQSFFLMVYEGKD